MLPHVRLTLILALERTSAKTKAEIIQTNRQIWKFENVIFCCCKNWDILWKVWEWCHDIVSNMLLSLKWSSGSNLWHKKSINAHNTQSYQQVLFSYYILFNFPSIYSYFVWAATIKEFRLVHSDAPRKWCPSELCETLIICCVQKTSPSSFTHGPPHIYS